MRRDPLNLISTLSILLLIMTIQSGLVACAQTPQRDARPWSFLIMIRLSWLSSPIRAETQQISRGRLR